MLSEGEGSPEMYVVLLYSSDRATTLVGYRGLRAAHRNGTGRIGHGGIEGVGALTTGTIVHLGNIYAWR